MVATLVKPPLSDKTIDVKHEQCCPNCGKVNFTENIQMSMREFHKLAEDEPKTYWKETKGIRPTYRFFEETSDARCNRSC